MAEMRFSKSPISWIQEIGQKSGQVPTWEIFNISAELKSITPVYKCVLTAVYNEKLLTAEGIDISKRGAKHDAACCMLDTQMELTAEDYLRIHPGVIKMSPYKQSPELAELENTAIERPEDAELGRNPAEYLIALCSALGIGVPLYQVKARVGPPHDPIFICECTVGNETRSDHAKTKKLAKRRVAYKWITTLRSKNVNMPWDENLTNSQGCSVSSWKPPVKRTSAPCNLSAEECAGLVSHKNHVFQKMTGHFMSILRRGDCNQEMLDTHGGPQGFLQLLAIECEFAVVRKERKCVGKNIMPVLATLLIKCLHGPPRDFVFLGVGENSEDARNKAAKEVLEFFVVVCK